MAEPKEYTITRSYSRKLNLGNYQTADFFASNSDSLLNPTEDEIKKLSQKLHYRSQEQVEADVSIFLVRREELESQKPEQSPPPDLPVTSEHLMEMENYKKSISKKKGETDEEARKRLLELAGYWSNRDPSNPKYGAINEVLAELPEIKDGLPF